MRFVIALVGLLTCVSGPASARESSEGKARSLYLDGKRAFDAGEFQSAYDLFKQSYLISERPQLLFNMSLALEELKRPHDAAEALRAYLRVHPADSDRNRIQARIAALEEKQRLLDAERAPPVVVTPAPVAPAVVAPAPAPLVEPIAVQRQPERRSRKGLIVGLTIGGVLLVGAGVGLGLGFGLQPSYHASSLGAFQATR